MKTFKLLFVGAIICLSAISCNKNEVNSDNKGDKIEITGTIQKQGITTYQYGTHTLSGYALRSSTENLDEYVNQNVTVVGHKISGYPIEGGPDFIEVEKLK